MDEYIVGEIVERIQEGKFHRKELDRENWMKCRVVGFQVGTMRVTMKSLPGEPMAGDQFEMASDNPRLRHMED